MSKIQPSQIQEDNEDSLVRACDFSGPESSHFWAKSVCLASAQVDVTRFQSLLAMAADLSFFA